MAPEGAPKTREPPRKEVKAWEAEESRARDIGRCDLGAYTICDAPVLGEGRSTVYRAICTKTGCAVAVKKLDRDDSDGVPHEVQIIKYLAPHSRLVAFYGYGLRAAEAHLVFEYCAQGSLTQHLRSFGPPCQQRRRMIMADVLDALRYVHGRRVVHRDVKSGNVLVCHDGVSKLCDFGLAAVLADGSDRSLMSVVGTPRWMAPEVAKLALPRAGRMEAPELGYGRPADVWSFGCLAIELATNAKPWAEEMCGDACFTDLEKIFFVARARALPRLSWDLRFSSPLTNEIHTRCMQFDPGLRDTSSQAYRRVSGPAPSSLSS